jgi:hypothetical protein
MRFLSDAVIVHLSPVQTRIVRDVKYASVFHGVTLNDGARRARISVPEISGLVARLAHLRTAIASDPDYSKERSAKIVDQIIYMVGNAATAHRLAYPPRAD